MDTVVVMVDTTMIIITMATAVVITIDTRRGRTDTAMEEGMDTVAMVVGIPQARRAGDTRPASLGSTICNASSTRLVTSPGCSKPTPARFT